MTRWYMVTKEPGNQTEDMDRSRRTQFAELVALIKKVSPPSRIGSFLSNITVVSRESVSTMMNCQPTPCKGT